MIPVKKLMTKNLVKVDRQQTVQDVAKLMKEKKIGSVLIAEGKEIVGIVTETDIVRKVVAQGIDAGSFLVKGIMSAPVYSIDGDKTIFEAGELMDEKRVRHLVVTENGEISGMISVRDIIHPKYYEEESW
ncbi:MAG: CBS domain-containing protein [Nitrospirae bacterium]|nr:CBS domain-containing protein [Nitrospirota bacterium]